MAAIEPAARTAPLEGLGVGVPVVVVPAEEEARVVLLTVVEAAVVVLRATVVLGAALEVLIAEVVVLVAVVVGAEDRVTVLVPWDEVTVMVEEPDWLLLPVVVLPPSAFLIWNFLEYWMMLSSWAQTKRRP